MAIRITVALLCMAYAVYGFAQGNLAMGVGFSVSGVLVLVLGPFLSRRTSASEAYGFPLSVRIYNALFALGVLAASFVLLALAFTGPESDRGGYIGMAVLAGSFGALLATIVVLFERKVRTRRRRAELAVEDEGPSGDLDGQTTSGITFYRHDTLQDAIRSYKIEVDGRIVGVLKPESSLTVPLPPGTYSCRAKISWTGSALQFIEVTQGPARRVLVAPAPELPSLRKSVRKTGWLELLPDDA